MQDGQVSMDPHPPYRAQSPALLWNVAESSGVSPEAFTNTSRGTQQSNHRRRVASKQPTRALRSQIARTRRGTQPTSQQETEDPSSPFRKQGERSPIVRNPPTGNATHQKIASCSTTRRKPHQHKNHVVVPVHQSSQSMASYHIVQTRRPSLVAPLSSTR